MGLGGLLTKIGGLVAAPLTGGASLLPALIGGGLGAVKHIGIDAPAEKRSRQLAATTIRNSPWTGMQAGPIKEAPGLFSSALQGASIGHTVGGELEKLAGAQSAANAPDAFMKKAGGGANAADYSKLTPDSGPNLISSQTQAPSFQRGSGLVANLGQRKQLGQKSPWYGA